MRDAPGAAIRRFLGTRSTLRGMLCMAVTSFALILLHAVSRQVSFELHAFEVSFFRIFFGLLTLTPVLIRSGLAPLRTKRPVMQFWRGTLEGASIVVFYLGLSLVGLAKTTALSFTSPLFTAVLAMLLLGERFRWRRATALVFGFAGALTIIRPGVIPLDLGALLVVGSTVIGASAMIVIKVVTRTDSSLTTTLYMGVWGTPVALAAAIPYWQWPTLEQYGWLALIGLIGAVRHLALAQAYRDAEATALAPVDFSRLLWAAGLGYIFFGEVLDFWSWIGATMIFAANTFIGYREAKAKADPGGGRE